MRAPVARVTVSAGAQWTSMARQAADDLAQAGAIAELRVEEAAEGAEPSVEVELEESAG